MASSDDRTQDWVLELHSLDSLDDPARPASLNNNDADEEDDSSILRRWSTELTPGDGEPEGRARGARAAPMTPSPLPGAVECLNFVKTRRGRLRPARQTRLRNNLLAAVGFLELGNAGDFAANVCTYWNPLKSTRDPLALTFSSYAAQPQLRNSSVSVLSCPEFAV